MNRAVDDNGIVSSKSRSGVGTGGLGHVAADGQVGPCCHGDIALRNDGSKSERVCVVQHDVVCLCDANSPLKVVRAVERDVIASLPAKCGRAGHRQCAGAGVGDVSRTAGNVEVNRAGRNRARHDDLVGRHVKRSRNRRGTKINRIGIGEFDVISADNRNGAREIVAGVSQCHVVGRTGSDRRRAVDVEDTVLCYHACCGDVKCSVGKRHCR